MQHAFLALFPFLLMASTATDNGWDGEVSAKVSILAPSDGGSYRPHQSLIPLVLIETDGAHPTGNFLRLALEYKQGAESNVHVLVSTVIGGSDDLELVGGGGSWWRYHGRAVHIGAKGIMQMRAQLYICWSQRCPVYAV